MYNVKIFFVYRSAAEFKGNCKTVKLFAKHMKVMVLLSSRHFPLGWAGEGGSRETMGFVETTLAPTYYYSFFYVTIFRVEIGSNSEVLM